MSKPAVLMCDGITAKFIPNGKLAKVEVKDGPNYWIFSMEPYDVRRLFKLPVPLAIAVLLARIIEWKEPAVNLN